MERTLAIIKPDAVKKGLLGEILFKIQSEGYKIVAMKMLRINPTQAGEFYSMHRGKAFYEDLTQYMSSAPIVPIVLMKDNAIEDYRNFMGATDPNQAAEGTLRKIYAESKSVNAVHGSDSPNSAEKEISFFFSESEIVANLQF
jgi:nucleoside-diphosphate kinase